MVWLTAWQKTLRRHDLKALGILLRRTDFVYALLALGLLCFSGWISFYFSARPLLEHEAWRETQTAITSYWMIREGWSLAYQTPVLGYPWTIPLELPIYQSIVAFIAWASDWPLDPVGRLVSYGFLLACLWPAYQTFSRLQISSLAFWILSALVLSSPVYLFFGRNFLMETVALFFTLSAIPYALDLRADIPKKRSILLFVGFASLGMLQKVTTALPILVVLSGVLITHHFLSHGLRGDWLYRMAFIFIAFLIPVVLTYAWFEYTDFYRNQNPFMASHSSDDMITSYFGTIDERLNPQALRELFWDRMMVQNAGGLIGVAVLCLSLLFADNRQRWVIVACLTIGFAVGYMFFRHHHFLDYYQTASIIYLAAALAVSLAVLASRGRAWRLLVPVVTAVILASNLYHFSIIYWPKINKQINAENEFVLAVSKVIKDSTPPDSAIIVFGLTSRASLGPISAWTSELAYYAERKSLTVPDEWLENLKWNPVGYLGDSKLGAVIFCGKDWHTKYADLIDIYKNLINRDGRKVADCFLMMPE